MTRFTSVISAIMGLVSLGALGIAVSTLPQERASGPAPASEETALMSLFVAPGQFDAAAVTVTGFLVAEEDESALYTSEDDAMARTGNKLAVELERFPREELEHVDKLYVRLSGTFHRGSSASLGSLKSVTRIVPAVRGPGGRLRYDDATALLPHGG